MCCGPMDIETNEVFKAAEKAFYQVTIYPNSEQNVYTTQAM
ncbi:hypothetical protein ES705_34955 [subsurface metagenome]